MTETIRTRLMDESDEKYKAFNRSLVPGDISPMLGVRTPKLREIAKELAKKEGREYIQTLRVWEEEKQVYYEELMLHGMIIGYLKSNEEERKKLLDDFVPRIDNWGVCDSCCMTYKFMQKNREVWYDYLGQYLKSDREYEIRFAVVTLLAHFITEEFIDRVLTAMERLQHEGYYVKMAVAWAISVCYVKFPEKTWDLLKEDSLDDFTHQKSIQKIRESFRVSREEKVRLNTLRRPKKQYRRKMS